MSTSNIDDLLLGGKSSVHPQTPEFQEPESTAPAKSDESFADEHEDAPDYGEEEQAPEKPNDDAQHLEKAETKSHETDDYGNEAPPENEAIRERLARQARKHQAEIDDLRAQLHAQGASREVQKAASDFEYNPEASGDWQQQLASFVKQTVSSMGREESESKQRYHEQQLQHEFESKFRAGIEKFHDFPDVIGALPFEISNPMTLATRAMSDPAAFLYAAAKRQPAELERISKMRDPYAQMTEMGKLEERMRKNKPTTQAPRPLGRSVEDSQSPESKSKKEPTIEELIARSDAKKLARRKATAMPSPRRR
jgi:hypothetical protein